MNTRDLSGVSELQADSLWLTAFAGTRLAEVVRIAAERGLRPLGFGADVAGTVGGWLSGCSRIPDRILGIQQPPVLGLEAMLADGSQVRSVACPRAAVGPDIFTLMHGTNGGFGAITAVTLKLEPIPEHSIRLGFRFASLESISDLVRTTVSDCIPPVDCKVYLEGAGQDWQGCVSARWDGDTRMVESSVAHFESMALRLGAHRLDSDALEEADERYSASRGGQLVASSLWSRLPNLLRAADELQIGCERVVLDRACLNGCRVRVLSSKKAAKSVSKKWDELQDPDQSEFESLAGARRLLENVRRELDPGSLLNPHAWPLKH